MAKKSRSPSPLRAHFVGIGGIGISALARWFLAENWVVTGSDSAAGVITDSLKKDGISVKIGHFKANLPKKPLNMVIYSPAVPKSNPELMEARRRGLKPLSYPQAVGCLTKMYKTIAIAGTHGKSTTTAMAGVAFRGTSFDPNVIAGTNLREFGNKNFRKGRDKWLLLEADEWRASFLNYSPTILVVTNIDKDHLDFYKNLAEIKKTFLKFMEKTREGGVLILNREDKNLRLMKAAILRIARRRDLEVVWYSRWAKDLGFKIHDLRKVLRVPGEHNVSNAAAVLAIAKVLGLRRANVLKGLSRYRGAWRRMELRGKAKFIIHNSKFLIPVYDDYAHHPTEIKATLKAFREKFPRSKIICVYQPHQAKRLKSLFREFVPAFRAADVLVLLPVYEVSGRDSRIGSYDSPALASAIKKKYPRQEVYYLDDPKDIKKELKAFFEFKNYKSDVVIVMMGAGDIVNYTPLLLKSSKP